MAVGAHNLALCHLFLYRLDAMIVCNHLADALNLIVTDMVKLKDYRVGFSAISAGSVKKQLP